ncbi:hypothetical protein [Propionicicella superfundia]|uniref:hypothetical protein n=1 Tax=Propionicicella superfundia TaxID=348582 RepID=UPI0003FB6927|nr:hypothetical protein [Propionicicella superfundia]
MKFSRPIALGVAAGLAIGAFGIGAPTASAEPVSDSFVAVGSDTLQDVMNALANGTNITGPTVRSTANGAYIGSFDATGSNWIQTKSNGVRFGRPNGSGDGVTALSRSIDGRAYSSGTVGGPINVTITGQVDIARSSSGPKTQDANGALRYIPFGRDALTYAHSAGDNAAFNHIDTAALKNLFDCTETTIGGVTVTPVIPQAGSGTRKDFLAKIGVTYASDVVPSCVKIGQEHDTSHLADGTDFPANAVTPMSAAQWVAQNTGAGIDRRGNGVKVGSPTGIAPVTGEGTAMVPNQAFYNDTTWGRDTYLVVENARVTSGDAKYDAGLANLVSSSNDKLGNTGTVAPSQAGSVKKKFGFLAPSSTTPLRAPLAD